MAHTLLALTVLEELHALEGSGTTNELVGEAGVIWTVVTIHLLVSILVVAWSKAKSVLIVNAEVDYGRTEAEHFNWLW